MAFNPQTAALNPAALIAASQQRSAFVPAQGGKLVVQFPGETMRVPVEKVLDDNTVIVRIDSPPVSRVHSFRFDEVVCVRRRVRPGREFWEAQTDRQFIEERDRLRAAQGAGRPAKPRPAAASSPEAAKPKAAGKGKAGTPAKKRKPAK